MTRTLTPTEAHNVKASLRTFHLFNERRFENIMDGHAESYTMYGDPLPEPVVGLKANLRYFKTFTRVFPDVHITLQECTPSGDMVFVRFAARGTKTHGFMGLPPTDRPFEFHALFINWFKDGLRTQTWQYFDNAWLLQQVDPRFPAILTAGKDPAPASGGAPPQTGDLERVAGQLRRVANFTFFSMPNAEQPNVPIQSGGQLIGVEVHENLHRFEIKQRLTASGLDVRNAVGQPTAQVHMHWRPIPDDFVARPGVEIPPTPLDPTRSQRFMMHDGRFTMDDSHGSGFRGFGSGRTFPVLVDGKPQLRLAAVVDVLEGLGKVEGHAGMLVVNGYIEPPDGLALCILLRLADPSGDFAARSRLPPLRPIADPDPDNLYLILLGEPVPGRPVEMLHGADGNMLGARGPQRMRLIDVVYDVKGQRGIRSRTAIGEVVGEMNADAWFDPLSGDPPYPFQTTGGSFAFWGKNGKPIGAVAADMVEGRALPTPMKGAAMPVFRVGGIAPVTSGSGCFRDAVGLFTIDSFISLVPNTISGVFVMHLTDPGGRLRRALADAWG